MYTRNMALVLTLLIVCGGAAFAEVESETLLSDVRENCQAIEIVPDTQVFKRTPVVDGVIEEGEWDTFYSFSAENWDACTFLDWDNDGLYVGLRSSRPVDALIALDLENDGWFHGDDNYELRTTRASDDSVTLSVSRYESRNSKSAVATPLSRDKAESVDVKCSRNESKYMMEMRIPATLIPWRKFENGTAMGCQIAINASNAEEGWVPGDQLGDTKECVLVSKKAVSLKPLEVGFDLRESRVAQGDDLVGRFHLTNRGSESLGVESFVIAGEGKAGEYLSSKKIRIESLNPGEHVREDYRTVVLSGMPVGSWSLGAEVRNSNGRMGSALVSFDVVEPFIVDLRLPDKAVRSDVKDVTVGAVIKNNSRATLKGTVKVAFPIGWDVWRDIDQREFRVAGRDMAALSFKAKPPVGAVGEIPVEFEVDCSNERKTVKGLFTMVNP